MSRFSGRQHPGAQATAREERRKEAEARNLLTAPERRKQYRTQLQNVMDGVTPPASERRKRGKK